MGNEFNFGWCSKGTRSLRSFLKQNTIGDALRQRKVCTRTRSTRRLTARRLTVAGVAMVTLGFAVGPAWGSGAVAKTASHKSPTQRGLAYYRGKTITFIAPDSPGGGFDVWSRLLAPYLATYLHAVVNVQNIPAGDTVGGQDALARAAPNGLTIGWLSPGIDIEIALSKSPGLNFNPEREAFIGMTEPSVTVLVSSAATGCPASMNAIIADSKSGHPSSVLLETVGILDEFSRLVNVAYGLNLKLISGYTSTANMLQGFDRGDGCLMVAPLAAVGSLIASGKAIPIVTFGKTVPGIAYARNLASTPTIQKAIKQYARSMKTKGQREAQTALVALTPDSGDTLAVPSTTSSVKVAALRAAMSWVMKNAAFRSAALALGEIPGLIQGSTSKQMYIDGLKLGAPVASDLG